MKNNLYFEVENTKNTQVSKYYNPLSDSFLAFNVKSNTPNHNVFINAIIYKIGVNYLYINNSNGIVQLLKKTNLTNPTIVPETDAIAKPYLEKHFKEITTTGVYSSGDKGMSFKKPLAIFQKIKDLYEIEKKALSEPKTANATENSSVTDNKQNNPSVISSTAKTPSLFNKEIPKNQSSVSQNDSFYNDFFKNNFNFYFENVKNDNFIFLEENIFNQDIQLPKNSFKSFTILEIIFYPKDTKDKNRYIYNLITKEIFNDEGVSVKPEELTNVLSGNISTTQNANKETTQSTDGSAKKEDGTTLLNSLKNVGISLSTGKMDEIVSSLSGLASDVRNKITQTIKDTGITNIIDTKSLGDKAIEILVPAGMTLDSKKTNYGVIDDKNKTITISTTKPQGNHVILNTDGKMSFITAKTPTNDSYNLIPRIGKIGAFFEASENLIYKDIFNINEEDGGSVKFEYALDKKDGKMKVIITGQPKIDDASIEARNSFTDFFQRKWFGNDTNLKIKKDDLVKAINDTLKAENTIKALNDLFNQYENRNNIIPSENFQETEKAIKKAIYEVIIKRDKKRSDISPSDLQKLIKLFDDKFGIELNDKGIFADYLIAKQGQSKRNEDIAGQIKAFSYRGDFFDFLNQQDAAEAEKFKKTLEGLDSKKDSTEIIETYMTFIGKMPDERVVLLYNYLKDRKNPMLINTPYEGLEHEKQIIIEIREMLLKRIKSNINILMKIILPKFRSALGDGVDMEKYYRMRIRNEFRYMGADDLKDENSQYTKTFKEIVAEMKKGKYLDKKLLLDLFNGVNAKEATLDFFTRVFGNNEKLNEKLRKAFQKEDADLEKNVETLDDKELLKKGGVFIGANDNWKRRAYIHEVIVGFEESGKVDQADIFKIGDFTGTTPDFIKRKLFGKKNEDFRKKLKTKLEEAGLTEETIKKSLTGNKEEEAEAAKKSKKEDTASEITNPVVDRIIKDYKNGKILTDDAEKARVLEELNNYTLSLETDERFIRKSLRIKNEDYLDAMMGSYKLISTFKKSPKELKAEKSKEEKKTEPSKEKSKEEKKKSYINKDGEIKLKNIGDAIKLITDNVERQKINTLIRQMGSQEVGNISDDDKSFIKRILDIDEAQYTAIVAASNRSSLLDKEKLGMNMNDSYQPKDNLEKFIFSEYYNIEDKMRKRRS
jgi:hypothetical protein